MNVRFASLRRACLGLSFGTFSNFAQNCIILYLSPEPVTYSALPHSPTMYIGDSEADYVTFLRSSRHSSEMDFGDNEDSGNDENADTPRPSLTDSMAYRETTKVCITVLLSCTAYGVKSSKLPNTWILR